MTQAELMEVILKMRCLSSAMAYKVAFNLANGDKNCNINNLILLNDYIDVLLKYNFESENCVTEDEFEGMLESAKYLSKLCTCD